MTERQKIKSLADAAVLLGNEVGVYLSMSPFVLVGATVDGKVATLTAIDIQRHEDEADKFCVALRPDGEDGAHLYTAISLFCVVVHLCAQPGAPRFGKFIESKDAAQRFLDRHHPLHQKPRAA